nr:hypothetical protein [Tanacetum cinerariifolium]
MRSIPFEVSTTFEPSLDPSTKTKEKSFNSNNSNEPISVLDTRRSPSPSTSTSTLSGGTTTTTTTAPPLGVTTNYHQIQQKWPENVPQEMGFSRYVANNCLVGGGELQPIPAVFEDDWENLLTQDQSLRWISGDFEDSNLSLQQLLQSNNQVDQNVASVENQLNTAFNAQNANLLPFSDLGFQKDVILDAGFQKDQNLNAGLPKDLILNQGFQKNGVLKPVVVVGAKQELVQSGIVLPHNNHHQHHQYQVMCDQLFAAAELMLSGNFSHAQGILARLNHQFSSASAQASNKPFQRAAFYFKEALQMNLQSLMSNSNLNPNRITPQFNGMFKMGAYKMFSEVSPIIQFMNFTSNQTIIEALGDANNIHIIDFDIGFGAQWASFIQELPNRNQASGGGCSLKITAFASPSTHHPIELGLMHENLSQFAQEIGISFELEVVNFDSFDPRSFSVSGNEAIAVSLPIWSASTHLSAIPSILHFVKQLSPRIVVSLDRGCERTDLPFPHYLLQGLQYYEVLLDSFDGANVVSDASNKIERFLFQPQIERMVLGKLQFPEPMPHWKSLFTAGGYSPVLFSNFAETQAECLVKRIQVHGFRIEKRLASLVLCWQNRELMTVSAWKC